jgi:hypothetical protein
MEAAPRLERGIGALQAPALPLGYAAIQCESTLAQPYKTRPLPNSAICENEKVDLACYWEDCSGVEA